jgi:hypothetical protein
MQVDAKNGLSCEIKPSQDVTFRYKRPLQLKHVPEGIYVFIDGSQMPSLPGKGPRQKLSVRAKGISGVLRTYG